MAESVFNRYTFGICMYSLSAIMHMFGLFAIYITRHSLFPNVQWLYIINMSTCQLVYSAALIVTYALAFSYPVESSYLEAFAYAALAYWLFASNMLIMVDRFMEVYLNIHYHLFWSEKKAKYVIVVSTLFCSGMGIIFAIFLRGEKFLLYVWIFLDFSHVAVAFVTYGYLYTRVRDVKKRNNKISEQILSNYHSDTAVTADVASASDHNKRDNGAAATTNSIKVHMKRLKRNFFLPTLFILNSALFTLLPDVLTFVYTFDDHLDYTDISIVTYVMYVLGFLFDAMIYIFASKKIRGNLKKKFLCLCSHNVAPWDTR